MARQYSIKLVVVRWDGTTMETTFQGYHAESLSDHQFIVERNDKRTAFAMTVLSDGGFRQRYVAEPLKRGD